ncbi:hypothetical protein LI328DRAFT_171746 [Trichoderma asperelloides]|nr:hypothetical protein LI328DRAFT_171746 [Trichoderma asperelloides]
MMDISCLETIESPCSHIYCHGCVTDLFKSAMVDESLFPPRCCGQHVPLESTKSFLSTALLKEYREKELEYGTSNRTYCYISTCLAFIPPKCIQNDVATYEICCCKTCAICKGPSHEYEGCPEDMDIEELLNTAANKKWQRCYSCRRMVELATGCNHITCRCKAEFCYQCGLQWKQCPCPLWHENRLLVRQVQRAERQRTLRVVPVECTHRHWTILYGGYQCERCEDWLPRIIFSCNGCGMSACRGCKR